MQYQHIPDDGMQMAGIGSGGPGSAGRAGDEEDSPSGSGKKRKRNPASKKSREQYSCIECFRRKQKCDRKFPCNNCVARRLPDRCIPPPGYTGPLLSPNPSTTPSRTFPNLPNSNNNSNANASTSAHPQGQPQIQTEQHHSPSPSLDVKDLQAGPRAEGGLPETTARLARLERLLSLQDHAYAEKRLKLAEEAVLSLLEGKPGSHHNSHNLHNPSDSSRTGDDSNLNGNGSGRDNQAGPSRHQMEGSGSQLDELESDGWQGDNIEVLGDNGYNGATALAALSRAPVLAQTRTSSARDSYHDRFFQTADGHLRGMSSSLDQLLEIKHYQSTEIRALFAVIPAPEYCQHYIDNYWKEWDWTRFPLPPGLFPSDWREWCNIDVFLELHTRALRETGVNLMGSLALFLSVLALGSVSPTLESDDGHARSASFFWAATKALSFCQSPGSNDSLTMWARAITARYADLIRNTQMIYYIKNVWVTNAIDQGLHRDGAGFGLPAANIAERRVLWSHILHADREWSLVLGRPSTIAAYSTLMPSEEDLAPFSWDFRQYILRRNEFVPLLERISNLFQDLILHRTPEAHKKGNYYTTDADNDKTYHELLNIDRDMDTYLSRLPAHFSLDPTKMNHALETKFPHLKVYRQIIISQVNFVRIIMHRPFMLKPLRKKKQHPYRFSWQRCVDTAVQDLRARRMWSQTLSVTEQRQMFSGAWGHFNSAIVLGLSILISMNLDEMPSGETYTEFVGHLKDCVDRCQADLDSGRDDAVSRRERRIMDSLLARLDEISIAQRKPGLSPALSILSRSASNTPTTEALRLPTRSNDVPAAVLPPSGPQSAVPIQFDPFFLQFFGEEVNQPPNAAEAPHLAVNQAVFNWEGFLSEMYNNDPILP